MAPPGAMEGRIALVTGASRGLGEEIALTLAAQGADVALAARSVGALEDVARRGKAHGRRLVALPCDVAAAEAARGLAVRCVEALGGLDVVVNNAGIAPGVPSVEVTPQLWDAVHATNLRSTFFVTAGAIPYLDPGSSVVNIASHFGLRGVSQYAAYSASKAGVIALTRSLAVELAAQGIRVNAVAPGYIETEVNRELRESPEALRRIVRRIPLGRFGSPSDVAAAAAFLASPASEFITGEVLVVDGGQTAR